MEGLTVCTTERRKRSNAGHKALVELIYDSYQAPAQTEEKVQRFLENNKYTKRLANNIEFRKAQFKLNIPKALKKKLTAANRGDLYQITENRDGFYYNCQTGLYELLRSALHAYYAQFKQTGMEMQATVTRDQTGNITQVVYRITNDGGSGLYTVNMYHTKSALYVNGKQRSQFVDRDWHNIMDLIQEMSKWHPTVLNDELRMQISEAKEQLQTLAQGLHAGKDGSKTHKNNTKCNNGLKELEDIPVEPTQMVDAPLSPDRMQASETMPEGTHDISEDAGISENKAEVSNTLREKLDNTAEACNAPRETLDNLPLPYQAEIAASAPRQEEPNGDITVQQADKNLVSVTDMTGGKATPPAKIRSPPQKPAQGSLEVHPTAGIPLDSSGHLAPSGTIMWNVEPDMEIPSDKGWPQPYVSHKTVAPAPGYLTSEHENDKNVYINGTTKVDESLRESRVRATNTTIDSLKKDPPQTRSSNRKDVKRRRQQQ